MDKQQYAIYRRLLAIAAGGMLLGGLILLGISIFGRSEDNTSLPLALLFIACGNLFNIVLMNMAKKHNKAETAETEEPKN